MSGIGRFNDLIDPLVESSLSPLLKATKFCSIVEKHATIAFRETQKATLVIIKALDEFLRKTFGVDVPENTQANKISPLLDSLVLSASARHFLEKSEFSDRPFLYWRLGFWFNQHDGRNSRKSNAMLRHQTALSTVRLVFRAPQESWGELFELCCSSTVTQRQMKTLLKEKNGDKETEENEEDMDEEDMDEDEGEEGDGGPGPESDDNDYEKPRTRTRKYAWDSDFNSWN